MTGITQSMTSGTDRNSRRFCRLPASIDALRHLLLTLCATFKMSPSMTQKLWILVAVMAAANGRCVEDSGTFSCGNICDEDVADSETFGWEVDFVGRTLDLDCVRFYGLKKVRLQAAVRCVGRWDVDLQRILDPSDFCQLLQLTHTTTTEPAASKTFKEPVVPILPSTTKETPSVIKKTSFSSSTVKLTSPILTSLLNISALPTDSIVPTNVTLVFGNGKAHVEAEFSSTQIEDWVFAVVGSLCASVFPMFQEILDRLEHLWNLERETETGLKSPTSLSSSHVGSEAPEECAYIFCELDVAALLNETRDSDFYSVCEEA
ncbi:unnamed protein product [Notodromas monacha]|uniref:Uncharacterized protein n=1 Tax=Notodromas monacha TaxID=399045 RepID=A0A7R9C0C4_9CRUS|nr:unnamed protein product [Notodromas monacha]CAG0923975.1 unnamed protein product [Notodromas monacha]